MSTALTFIIVLTTAVVLFQGLLIVALFRRCHEVETLIARVDADAASGPRIDRLVPSLFQREARTGTRVTLDLFGEHGGALVFLSAGCGACQSVLEGLSTRHDHIVPMIVLFKGTLADLPAQLCPPVPLVLLSDAVVLDSYRITGFPDVLLVNGDHTLALRANPTSYESFCGVVNAWSRQTGDAVQVAIAS